MPSLKLEDDKMCFVCGPNNPLGLRLHFVLEKDNILKTEFTPSKMYQGFKDVVHGGIIALILDEIMLNLVWRLGKHAVTGQIDVKFKLPAKINETIYFSGRIIEEETKIIYTEAQAQDKNRNILAAATAKCVKLKSA